jgi:hypothetical protein
MILKMSETLRVNAGCGEPTSAACFRTADAIAPATGAAKSKCCFDGVPGGSSLRHFGALTAAMPEEVCRYTGQHQAQARE